MGATPEESTGFLVLLAHPCQWHMLFFFGGAPVTR
jgi:hypothetical protein